MFKASLVLTFVSSSRKFLQLFELWKTFYSGVAQKITKNLYSRFSGKRPPEGTCGWPGGSTTQPEGQVARPSPLAAPPTLLGGPQAPRWHLFSHSLFLPENLTSSSDFLILAVLELVPSISSSSHLFELISWTSALWYVTPSPLQLVF